MRDRDAEIAVFLNRAGWQSASRTRIAGDMSSRAYSRLSLNGLTAILMDAETSMRSFVEMTHWLESVGLSVPEVLLEDAEAGLLLLEDFGDLSMKAAIVDAEKSELAYDTCLQILLRIRASEAPDGLLQPDAKALSDDMRIVDDFVLDVDTGVLSAFRGRLARVLESVLAVATCVSLRDFHSENMMWLPDRSGLRRLGLLDYQDAFLTHPAYDLVSLLTDARTSVSRERRQKAIARYITLSGDDPDRFETAFAALSVQRNMRILGVFARAKKNMEFMPNTFGYLAEALEHPVFAKHRPDVLGAFPDGFPNV